MNHSRGPDEHRESERVRRGENESATCEQQRPRELRRIVLPQLKDDERDADRHRDQKVDEAPIEAEAVRERKHQQRKPRIDPRSTRRQ